MSAKAIFVAPVERAIADEAVSLWHYSGKTFAKARLHVGVFDGSTDRMVGAAQLGPAIFGLMAHYLVPGTPWDGYLELSRFCLSPAAPRMAASRALGAIFRELRRNAPWIEWLLSYADAGRSGDGTIYRATGMISCGWSASTFWRTAAGEVVSELGIKTSPALRERLGVAGTSRAAITAAGLLRIDGWNNRYIKPLDPNAEKRIRGRAPHQPLSGLRPERASPVGPDSLAAEAITWSKACEKFPRSTRAPYRPIGRLTGLSRVECYDANTLRRLHDEGVVSRAASGVGPPPRSTRSPAAAPSTT